MTKILVDGQELDVPPEYTLMQACEEAGAEIPRFCYHERLSVAGNCRMCLIEVKVGGRAGPKPIASCAQQVKDLPPPRDNMLNELITRSPAVEKARKGVMEFLLINHPLDCPICDQGGECDLQDQAMAFGRGGSRYDENKRAVEEKNMGPLVKTVMNRCIQCTRCVRFVTEVAGVPEIGAISRGEDMEITTYLEAALSSELSANVIDLCPVGALTSKPYAFHARPWELTKTESVDVMDALGCAIRVDARGDEVLRVLPRVHEGINEEWISDKTRFAIDGLGRQRLDRPYVRKGGKLTAVSWEEALQAAAQALRAGSIGALAGDLACVESMKALRDLYGRLGSTNLDCRADGAKIGGGPRESYLFNSTIAGVDEADVILLVGCNPRLDAPVLNARLRKRWLSNDARIGLIGARVDLTFDYEFLGEAPGVIAALPAAFAQALTAAKRPMIILGYDALTRPDGAALAAAAARLATVGESWNGFNVLHRAAARVGALDLGFLPGTGGKDAAQMLTGGVDTLFLLGVDEATPKNVKTVIYLGTHGDAGAHHADIILPGAAYTEKDALWVNTEGRVQFGRRATFPKGDAKEDWAIIRALSERVGHTLPYDDLDGLRARLFAEHPSFGQIDYAPGALGGAGFDLSSVGAAGPIDAAPLRASDRDFYQTNPIARASRTMAECSKALAQRRAALGAAAE